MRQRVEVLTANNVSPDRTYRGKRCYRCKKIAVYENLSSAPWTTPSIADWFLVGPFVLVLWVGVQCVTSALDAIRGRIQECPSCGCRLMYPVVRRSKGPQRAPKP